MLASPNFKPGRVFKTKRCGELIILSYEACDKITVRFLNTGTIKKNVKVQKIKEGNVKDPFARIVVGIGFEGVGPYIPKEHPITYQRWYDMLHRVYGPTKKADVIFYSGCSVDENWHNFQNYAEWEQRQYIPDQKIYQLDKDLKVKGNRVYSPATCSMIPKRLNLLISADKKNSIGSGVSKSGNRYEIRVTSEGNRRSLGIYDTVVEATKMYQNARYEVILNMCEKLYEEGELTHDLYVIAKRRFSVF